MKLALGTVQFGLPYGISNTKGQVKPEQATNILNLAKLHDIDMLDTAISYGESELYLGQFGVEDFNIVTKLSDIPDGKIKVSQWLHEEVEKSLDRLKIDSLYALLFHNTEQLKHQKILEINDTLKAMRNDGLIKKIGVSIASSDELNFITSVFNPEIIQAPFNLIDQRLYTSGWLDRLKERGIEIHIRSIFLQGLLLMSKSEIPKKFNFCSDILSKWHLWLTEQSIQPLDACLGFVKNFPQIDRVLIGVQSPRQLKEIISINDGLDIKDFPNIMSDNEKLVNPSNWQYL